MKPDNYEFDDYKAPDTDWDKMWAIIALMGVALMMFSIVMTAILFFIYGLSKVV